MEIENFLNAIVLLGIPSVVLVPVLVQGLKALGLPPRWAGLAAVAAGLIVAALAEAIAVWPGLAAPVRVVLGGLLLGLAAAGAYSQYRVFRE